MAAEAQSQMEQQNPARTIAVPAPTAWPMILSFGLSLVFAGLATSAAVSLLGAIAAIAGAVGWFRAVLPQESMEEVETQPQPPPSVTLRREVVHLQVVRDSRRAWLPIEIYPVSAGIKGGIAGGLVMAVIAILYGVVSHTGIWYPINLLAAGFYPGGVMQTTAQIAQFQPKAFTIAFAIHGLGSILVGILYGALLPMFPRRPVLLAGLAVPLLWTALFHSFIGIINPTLNDRIDWIWFIVSQIGFGLVAGMVVTGQERIRTWQGAPFAFRAGLEGTGLGHDTPEEKKR